ncbi:MAG: RICIN domain-containing protein [Saprospiraceae bacterium]
MSNYTFKCQHPEYDELVLSVTGYEDNNKTYVFPDNGWNGTMWKIKNNDDGTCCLISQNKVSEGLVLSTSGKEDDNKVHVYPDNGWIGTKWKKRDNPDGTVSFICQHEAFAGQVLRNCYDEVVIDVDDSFPGNNWIMTEIKEVTRTPVPSHHIALFGQIGDIGFLGFGHNPFR